MHVAAASFPLLPVDKLAVLLPDRPPPCCADALSCPHSPLALPLPQVAADKLREVTAGHDGTWVAHPELVKLATAIFNERMPQPNQLYVRREDVHVTAADLLNISGIRGGVSEAGVGGTGSLVVLLVAAGDWWWLCRGCGMEPLFLLATPGGCW